jgi:Holliday junction resolvase RusA-like endonuclease
MIVIDVLGSPAPKGNARAFMAGGKAVLSSFGSGSGEKRLRSWDAEVRSAAIAATAFKIGGSPVYVQRPLSVGLVFRMSRPGGHWSKKGGLLLSAPKAPTVKPDIDKLTRSTLDALHGTIFDDDSRIVELGVVKTYAEPGREGARIVVKEWTPT